MKLRSRVAGTALAVAAGLALVTAVSPSTAAATGGAGSAPATAPAHASAATEATWHLAPYEQRACIPANASYWTYFVGFIAGSWSTPLNVDVQGLPPGTDSTLPHPPIAPRSNGAQYIGTVWVAMTLPPLDFGEYRAEMKVTDGVVTQTMPIVIKAQQEWGCGRS